MHSQEYNYVQYDTKDGLAGSTVYDMCQDKDGFLWFGTENGLTRYDGTHFKTYTVADGLPDNEVLKLSIDSTGRVWVGTFSKEICYYQNGVICNSQNTRWLNQIKLSGAALSIVAARNGIIMISDLKNVFQISDTNDIQNLSEKPILNKYRGQKITCGYSAYYGICSIVIGDTSFIYDGERLILYQLPLYHSDRKINLKNFIDGSGVVIDMPDHIINENTIGPATVFVNTTNGAWSVDTVNLKLKEHFLKARKVTCTLNDKEGNLWFSTLGEGVYLLPSLDVKNILLPSSGVHADSEIYSISKYKNGLLFGSSFSKVFYVINNQVDQVIDFQKLVIRSVNNSSINRLYDIHVLQNDQILFAFDAFLLKKLGSAVETNKLIAVKSLDQVNDETVVVGTHNYVYLVSIKDLSIKDTVFSGRATRVKYFNGKYYIGSLNGLFEVSANKTVKSLSSISYLLSRRINDISISNDGTLWVATNDAGVVGFKNGQIVDRFDQTSGLSSNICRCLFLDGDNLYVGTNRGINKINLVGTEKKILKYSKSDGLPTDLINTIFVFDSTIYVGSSKGIAYFKERNLIQPKVCKIKIMQMAVSDSIVSLTNTLRFPYKNNNVRFNYIVISFKSGGEILYHYRLLNFDTVWRTTSLTNVTFENLPADKYKFEIYGTDKFGSVSALDVVKFTIEPPFWQTWWFTCIIIAIAGGIAVFLIHQRDIRIKEQLKEKNRIDRLIASIEQQALQSQMNPHFIFNCLNSIQQFILKNDKHDANLYLAAFSSLVRQILYISSKKSITVSEEVDFLIKYLEMEKLRYGNSFDFRISGIENPEIASLQMPVLLLQPFVENALKHGLRYKETGGLVIVSFAFEHDTLICSISDNGIGRARAKEFKRRNSFEYESKGMSLTQRRIELMNKMDEREVDFDVIDKIDELGEATGTEVIIKLPL